MPKFLHRSPVPGPRFLRAAAVTGAAVAITASFAPSAGAAATGTVNLVAYSTPSAAYTAIAKAFSESPAGKSITVAGSFGASGTQEKNVAAGQAADVVNFSLAPDMDKLVTAGLVSPSWDKVGPDHGNVTDSVVVFIVRPGNPKHIHGWSDLVKPGVQVVTPNPFSSGSVSYTHLSRGQRRRHPHFMGHSRRRCVPENSHVLSARHVRLSARGGRDTPPNAGRRSGIE